jgi:hypothetical protein
MISRAHLLHILQRVIKNAFKLCTATADATFWLRTTTVLLTFCPGRCSGQSKVHAVASEMWQPVYLQSAR